MNVLYLSYDGMTDPLGQSQVIPYLKGLHKLGHTFHLVSFEKPERFENSGTQIKEALQQAGINWHPQMYTKNPPVVSTMLDLQKMEKVAFKLHNEQHFDVVHCRSYIAAMVGLKLKQKTGLKFLFDMRGFWADERVEGGIWNLGNPLFKSVYRFFKKKEREFFSNADYTISLTENGMHEIQSWKSIPNQPIPIQVIPCCADLDLFSTTGITASAQKNLRKELGINEGDFVLSYLGSVGTWYMPDEMFQFFAELETQLPSARFLFISPDSSESILAKAIENGIKPEKIIVTKAPHHRVPEFLSLSNWSIFFIKPVFSKKASSPTKQGEIMGMGIPHVCNAGVGDVDHILSEGKAGVIVPAFNTESYRNAIAEMLADGFVAGNIRMEAEKWYSLKEGVARYNRVYALLAASA